jgi:hypothetical protein
MPENIAENLHELIAAPIDDAEVTAFLATLDPVTRVLRAEDQWRWISESAGVEIHAESSRRIMVVFLYNQDVDGFSRYRGSLPHGLRFDMTREEVTAAMGQPPVASGEHHQKWDVETSTAYGFYGLVVMYRKSGPIRDIGLLSY